MFKQNIFCNLTRVQDLGTYSISARGQSPFSYSHDIKKFTSLSMPCRNAVYVNMTTLVFNSQLSDQWSVSGFILTNELST